VRGHLCDGSLRHHGGEYLRGYGAGRSVILRLWWERPIPSGSPYSLLFTARRSALFQQGVDYANGEFIQVAPTAIPGEDKLR